jgi:hypothetical protein
MLPILTKTLKKNSLCGSNKSSPLRWAFLFVFMIKSKKQMVLMSDRMMEICSPLLLILVAFAFLLLLVDGLDALLKEGSSSMCPQR